MSGDWHTRVICRSIDHVMLRLQNIEPLFSLLTKTLCLPVTWPLQHSDFASFAWVHVGNTSLELWAAKNNGDLPAECSLPLVHGLALEPDELAFSIAELERQGIACKQPRPYQTLNARGQTVSNFTNSVILDVSSQTTCNFFCEWGAQCEIAPWGTGLGTVQRHEEERLRFAETGGGSLGVVRLARVGLQCCAVQDMARHWRTLAQVAVDDSLEIDGIALDVTPGERDSIHSLSFEVRSLRVARDFLVARGLLGNETTLRLTLSERATGGLVFHLIAANAALN